TVVDVLSPGKADRIRERIEELLFRIKRVFVDDARRAENVSTHSSLQDLDRTSGILGRVALLIVNNVPFAASQRRAHRALIEAIQLAGRHLTRERNWGFPACSHGDGITAVDEELHKPLPDVPRTAKNKNPLFHNRASARSMRARHSARPRIARLSKRPNPMAF